MRSENKAAIIGIFLCVIQMIAVFIAIFDMPYEYYQFLRVFVFISSIILLVVALNVDDLGSEDLSFTKAFVPPLVNAFVFNPIKPILMNKGAWIFFDIVAILMLVCLTFSYAQTIRERRQ